MDMKEPLHCCPLHIYFLILLQAMEMKCSFFLHMGQKGVQDTLDLSHKQAIGLQSGTRNNLSLSQAFFHPKDSCHEHKENLRILQRSYYFPFT